MPKTLILADLPSILNQESSSISVIEGTVVSVTCSQSDHGGRKLKSNRSICYLDVNKTYRSSLGFPLKVTVHVKRQSSKKNSSTDCCYLVDHKAEYIFWVPKDSIHVSDDAFIVISKIILLMNAPFSLDVVTLENREAVISKIVKFGKSIVEDTDGYMAVEITKTTCLREEEFMEIYNNTDEMYSFKSWERAQEEVESRIAKFEALQKEVGMKKMRFDASEFEGCNLSDMCSICREEFSTGSMISCMDDCSHVYHEVCILEWLLKNRSCPYCRSELGTTLKCLDLG